jgi:hypothetical protein
MVAPYAEFPRIMADLLSHCASDPDKLLAVLLLSPDGSAQLDFVQNAGGWRVGPPVQRSRMPAGVGSRARGQQ